MKILKPGKVEQRKFVCPKCGCEFVADRSDVRDDCMECPQLGCSYTFSWRYEGKPYEEPERDVQSDAQGTWPYSFGALSALTTFLAANGVTFKYD